MINVKEWITEPNLAECATTDKLSYTIPAPDHSGTTSCQGVIIHWTGHRPKRVFAFLYAHTAKTFMQLYNHCNWWAKLTVLYENRDNQEAPSRPHTSLKANNHKITCLHQHLSTSPYCTQYTYVIYDYTEIQNGCHFK